MYPGSQYVSTTVWSKSHVHSAYTAHSAISTRTRSQSSFPQARASIGFHRRISVSTRVTFLTELKRSTIRRISHPRSNSLSSSGFGGGGGIIGSSSIPSAGVSSLFARAVSACCSSVIFARSFSLLTINVSASRFDSCSSCGMISSRPFGTRVTSVMYLWLSARFRSACVIPCRSNSVRSRSSLRRLAADSGPCRAPLKFSFFCCLLGPGFASTSPQSTRRRRWSHAQRAPISLRPIARPRVRTRIHVTPVIRPTAVLAHMSGILICSIRTCSKAPPMAS